jgi:hypothetical protein
MQSHNPYSSTRQHQFVLENQNIFNYACGPSRIMLLDITPSIPKNVRMGLLFYEAHEGEDGKVGDSSN